MESKELTQLICKTVSDKKAEDVIYLDVAEKTILCEYYVICTGLNPSHVKSLCEYVEEAAEKNGATVRRTEGVAEGRWAVIDLGEVIVHVFDNSARDFYRLERLWGEGVRYVEE